MKYTRELQMCHIKELMYLECRKHNIALATDEDLLDKILDGGAELIVHNIGNCKDPREVLDQIDEWIRDTQQNCPNYFIKGDNF